jgi:two-component system, NtrC family, response regulator GlrR
VADVSGVTHPTDTPTPRAIRRFRVQVTAGPSRGLLWNELSERCAIGSHVSNDLVIADPTVSRFHCELRIDGAVVRVRDLGSRNGTSTAGVGVVECMLGDGGELAIGHTSVRIDLDPQPTELATPAAATFGSLIGGSPAMRDVFDKLAKAAKSEATVLVEGETGTGKEGIAEALHEHSDRASGPFVVIDCGAIAANLLESELFGHEAGAFTGAVGRRIGAFEQASRGTIFLDEIGELPLELQPKLLRMLEAREIRRVGGKDVIACDVRIVAATNRDLRAEVNRATFRADLYFRLAVVKIELPPLRERREDVPLLVTHLLRQLQASARVEQLLLEPDFLAELSRAPWVGNVRELRNHLEQCVVFEERLSPGAAPVLASKTNVHANETYEIARRRVLDEFERAYVVALLERTAGNVAAAARDAGVNRSYLHRLIRRHDLR